MKIRTTLSLSIAALLSATATHASTWDASASLARFNKVVARGLPQPAFPVDATNEEGVTSNGRLVVESKLDATVELPNGSAMNTYVGSWDGTSATISHGDGQLLLDVDAAVDEAVPSRAVARFDTAITTAFPAHVHLSESFAPATHVANDSDDLVVSGEFGGDITFADGSHGRMYDASWHGLPVVATRSGNHLDITSGSADGIDITGFTLGSDVVEHEILRGGDSHGSPPAIVDTAPAPQSRSRRSTDDELAPNRLTFHLMLHDDVSDSSQHIHAGYIAWWLADLQRNIVHGKKVDVLYSKRIPGVTDTRYQLADSLHDWSDVIEAYATEQHIPRTYKHKFVLLVKGLTDPGRYGRSWQKGSDGIASISGRYPEVAHQLGHLLGAKHSNAEVRFSGWWCETNMYAPSLLLRSNCYGYSSANKRLINEYIKTGDGFVAGQRWSEDR